MQIQFLFKYKDTRNQNPEYLIMRKNIEMKISERKN